MSEYQCYEFVALDRQLTAKQMTELRAISTRAEISPTRFWNEYQWGDLKADPAKLMERYFDAHLYFANWGTHRLMLRVPLARVDEKGLRPYFLGSAARSRVVGNYVVFDLRSETEAPESDKESQGSLALLSPLRSELMRGDLRVAYLAWLLAVQAGDVDHEDEEPPVPPGLSELTAAQEAMVELLRIDEDLLSAAAAGSSKAPDELAALRRWVARLSTSEKDAWLCRAVEEPDLAVGGELLRAFRTQKVPRKASHGRTAAELRKMAEAHREKRERVQAVRKARAKRAAEAARERRFDGLSKRLESAWIELDQLVEKSAYDEALKLAIDLRDLAARQGEGSDFAARFEVMRKRQLRRRGFFDRWRRANEARRW
jgi:hypothetical protein